MGGIMSLFQSRDEEWEAQMKAKMANIKKDVDAVKTATKRCIDHLDGLKRAVEEDNRVVVVFCPLPSEATDMN